MSLDTALSAIAKDDVVKDRMLPLITRTLHFYGTLNT